MAALVLVPEDWVASEEVLEALAAALAAPALVLEGSVALEVWGDSVEVAPVLVLEDWAGSDLGLVDLAAAPALAQADLVASEAGSGLWEVAVEVPVPQEAWVVF